MIPNATQAPDPQQISSNPPPPLPIVENETEAAVQALLNSQENRPEERTEEPAETELDPNILAALGTTPVTQKPLEIELDKRVAQSLLHTRNHGADRAQIQI